MQWIAVPEGAVIQAALSVVARSGKIYFLATDEYDKNGGYGLEFVNDQSSVYHIKFDSFNEFIKNMQCRSLYCCEITHEGVNNNDPVYLPKVKDNDLVTRIVQTLGSRYQNVAVKCKSTGPKDVFMQGKTKRTSDWL